MSTGAAYEARGMAAATPQQRERASHWVAPFPSVDRVRLRRASAGELVFEARSRLQAAAVLCPPLGVLAALPWLARAELDALRLFVSAAFAAGTGGAVRRCLPRSGAYRVTAARRELVCGTARQPLPEHPRWELGMGLSEGGVCSAY